MQYVTTAELLDHQSFFSSFSHGHPLPHSPLIPPSPAASPALPAGGPVPTWEPGSPGPGGSEHPAGSWPHLLPPGSLDLLPKFLFHPPHPPHLLTSLVHLRGSYPSFSKKFEAGASE